MRRLTLRPGGDDGNVIVITALLATTLLGFTALTIDVGALLVRRSGQQTAADAAAVAVAKLCADRAVASSNCAPGLANGTKNSYVADNLDASSWTAPMSLETWYGGRAGKVTVEVTTQVPPRFGDALPGVSAPPGGNRVVAEATARWGPLTAIDAAFPLAVCSGALPAPDESFELVVDPAAGGGGPCTGDSTAQAFGWVTPDDPAACTRKITLLPASYLDVLAADAPPTDPVCTTELDAIHDQLTLGTNPQRNAVVYDAGSGTAGARPAFSLVTIEFDKARFAGRESHADPAEPWTDPVCEATDPLAIDDVQCIAGTVRLTVTPTDGPIFDPALAALPGIDDTTVLDVRLVD